MLLVSWLVAHALSLLVDESINSLENEWQIVYDVVDVSVDQSERLEIFIYYGRIIFRLDTRRDTIRWEYEHRCD